MRAPNGERGSVLISSFLAVSFFLVYSNAMTIRVLTQHRVADRLREQLQALDLARGATEQLRDDLHRFLTSDVYQTTFQGDAIQAMVWLDSQLTASPQAPLFFTGGQGGTSDKPRCLPSPTPTTYSLPTISRNLSCVVTSQPVQAPRAWLTSIVKDPTADPSDPIAPRLVTMEAEARMGGTTKRIRVIYKIELGMSDIFRFAYFLNNFGWFQTTNSNLVRIHGEVRTNGDLRFAGNTYRLKVMGDLYASRNPNLINPLTGNPVNGTISGNPGQRASQLDYWQAKSDSRFPTARPTLNLTFPNQPAIGGTPKTLPYGYGWDSNYPNPSSPDQRQFAGQPIFPMPYLGNIADFTSPSYYRTLATLQGGQLSYYDSSGSPVVVHGVSTDTRPLVLVGTQAQPIVINGPVVIPGDVIIKGVITGLGTLYAGRNIHIVGDVTYQKAPVWPVLERDTATGQVRERNSSGAKANLGYVCNNGSYQAPTAGGCP